MCPWLLAADSVSRSETISGETIISVSVSLLRLRPRSLPATGPRSNIVVFNTTATSAHSSFFFFFFQDMIPRWKWTRKYCSSKIPVIKGVYKTLFFTEYKAIMLFLPRGICSKRQNTLYMVWIYTREKLTIINTGLFRAQHLNYGSNVSQYWIKVRDISVNSQPFFT